MSSTIGCTGGCPRTGEDCDPNPTDWPPEILVTANLCARDCTSCGSIGDRATVSITRRSGGNVYCFSAAATSESSPQTSSGRWNSSRITGKGAEPQDRKSTRLNSSHVKSSYAVFCLKKKSENDTN